MARTMENTEFSQAENAIFQSYISMGTKLASGQRLSAADFPHVGETAEYYEQIQKVVRHVFELPNVQHVIPQLVMALLNHRDLNSARAVKFQSTAATELLTKAMPHLQACMVQLELVTSAEYQGQLGKVLIYSHTGVEQDEYQQLTDIKRMFEKWYWADDESRLQRGTIKAPLPTAQRKLYSFMQTKLPAFEQEEAEKEVQAGPKVPIDKVLGD